MILLDETGEIADKIKIKTVYDTAESIQKAAIMQQMLELLALQTTMDGNIKAPPPIAPKQCLLLAEKCINAWIRLVYKADGKAVLTMPQTIGTDTKELNEQNKLQE